MEPTRIEVSQLREQFQDAEAICHALCSGEVDGVVVGHSDRDKRVLLLSGAYTRYRQLVEDMQQGAVTVSSSGEILFANHAFADMVGASLVDVLRSQLLDHAAPEERDKLRPLLAPHAGQRDVEVSLLRPDNTRAHVRAGVVSASDDFVTLIITLLHSEDQEEAAATLEAIRRGSVDAFVVGRKGVALLDSAQAPYRALVERMRQGAVTVQSDGKIVYANERFASTIGLPHGRLIGKPLEEMIIMSDRQAYAALLAARDESHAELRLRCENGQHPVMLATMTSLDEYKLFLFTDLSEQKRHQASDERTRRFLGMLAHEFRGILGPINQSAYVLKSSPALGPEGQKAVEIIERQCARLLALVEDLARINPKE
jgi:PAS domain S-box-containing protein